MTDVSRLKVSLTKHNAHKVATLLKKYRANEVLDKLGEVQAEPAQAYKNLSVRPDNTLPEVWEKVQKLGDSAIDALVFVAIVFSHEALITAMVGADNRIDYSGRIRRDMHLGGKAYTNFARILDQLGFATRSDLLGVSFNLRPMFQVAALGPLVGELLEQKLKFAGWNGGSVAEECISHGWHQVFGLSEKQFKDWIIVGAQPADASTQLLPKDEEFFHKQQEETQTQPFEFKPGHTERTVEPVERTAAAQVKAKQLHNQIQNELFAHLRDILGPENVGTEMNTGQGTSVDLATRKEGKLTFFEIKTSPSVRTSIRQALPQLLEYAFWPSEKRADELVVVSHLPITADAKRYLDYLRSELNIPVSYRQFDLASKRLL